MLPFKESLACFFEGEQLKGVHVTISNAGDRRHGLLDEVPFEQSCEGTEDEPWLEREMATR